MEMNCALSREAASQYLARRWCLVQAPATLARKAVTGEGPAYYLAGRFPRYSTAALDAWAQTLIRPPAHRRTAATTSEPARAA